MLFYSFLKGAKCDKCGIIKLLIAFDNSAGEYNTEYLCLDCIKELFEKGTDGEIATRNMRN